MPTSTDRTTVIPTRVTMVPADPVTPPEHPAEPSTAPAVTPPTWSGRKTAVVAALAIGFASVGAVGAAAAMPDQAAATGRTGPGGFPGGAFPGGQNGVPGGQLPGGQTNQGAQSNQGTQGLQGFGWHHDRDAQGSQGLPGAQGSQDSQGLPGSQGSQGSQPGQLPVLPQAPGRPGRLGGSAGSAGADDVTAFAGALHLRRWRSGRRAVVLPAAAAPAVRFKDLGALPVCGGSVRPPASQRALAARFSAQP